MTNLSKRIGYIDALRGFTMILVVFNHIYIPNTTVINEFLINFRMPLFFFISGFISFRAEQSWSGRETLSRLGSKVRTMIIPALTIGLIFTLVYGSVPITDFFTRPTKMGYWFTFALFNMLIVYYTARYLHARRDRQTLEVFTKRFYVIGVVVLFALSDLSAIKHYDSVLTLGMTAKYLHYFAFGALCSCHREWFEGILDNGKKMAIVIVGLFMLSWWLVTIDANSELLSAYVAHRYIATAKILIKVIVGYFGILTVFGLFRRYSTLFSENKFIGKPLQFVGRNTLDVYLLHYFVLLGMPAMLRPYIVDTTNMLIPLIVGGAVAIATVAMSLLISRIIRLSDPLAYYLLGARDVTLKNTNDK
ncbi:MAG: acyltransferase family protein [Alistipes sp.]|nr:acyltransferase family protein [Alistipes sp.]